MAELDIAAKVLLQEAPAAFVRLALGDVKVRTARSEDTELPALSRRMDRLIRYELEGEEEPGWLNAEVQANWKANVPARAFDYWSLAFRRFKRLETVVICLRRGKKQGRPVSQFEVACGRTQLHFRYRLILLWDLKAADLLVGAPGLIPLLPYADGATQESVATGMKRLATVRPFKKRAELQAALATFAEDVFRGVDWTDTMPEELLMASTIYGKGRAKGQAEGRVEGQRHTLTLQLQERLGASGESFAIRLAAATQATLDEVTRVLATDRPAAGLIKALSAVLPPQTE